MIHRHHHHTSSYIVIHHHPSFFIIILHNHLLHTIAGEERKKKGRNNRLQAGRPGPADCILRLSWLESCVTRMGPALDSVANLSLVLSTIRAKTYWNDFKVFVN